MKREESEILVQGALLTFLKPANTEEKTFLSDERYEILSEGITSNNPTASCLLNNDPAK